MTLVEGLRSSPGFLAFATLLLGLCVGSFLNVVIHRLPLILQRRWRAECRELLELPAEDAGAPLSLWRPASRCPACGAAIRPWHNVPVVSWVLLRGRCAACSARISPQYPLVELATGLLSAACAWRFGWSPQLAAALVLTWTLVALSVIDLRTLYLFDDLVLPLLWLGLLLSLLHVFTDPRASILGAVLGYGFLWGVFHLFRLLTGKEGFGYGDFKLLAALGAWLGWTLLPQIVLLSALVGSAVGITLIALRRAEWGSKIPFGPYIAAAGWIALMWGAHLNRAYLATVAPH